jgi:hypothetical protein
MYYLGPKNRKMDQDMTQAEAGNDGMEKKASLEVEQTSSSFRYML